MNPFQLSEQNGGHKVPCGKCLNCKRRRASSWSVRLVKEGERSISAHFLTLTYDTEHVPISKNGFMNLDKTHLQKFFKRLRKCHGKNHKSIKYYAVGEYGGKTLRPHYHMVIFNADVNLFERSWALDNKQIGQIHVGTITEASIGYTLKYISKASKIPLHKNDDRQKRIFFDVKRFRFKLSHKKHGTMAQKQPRRTCIRSPIGRKKSAFAALLQREDIRRIREGKNSLSLSEESEYYKEKIKNYEKRKWQQSSIFPC